MNRLMRIIAGAIVPFAVLFSADVIAQTHTFTLNVPRKVQPGATPPGGGPCQVSTVHLIVSFAVAPSATITSVTFQVTEPDKKSDGSAPETWTVPTLPANHTFQVPPAFGGVTPLFGDKVNVSLLDQASQRYEIDFSLLSNYVDSDKSTQQLNPDVYTVVANVTTNPANSPVTISTNCVDSFDGLNRSIANASCAAPPSYLIPLFEPGQVRLLIDGTSQQLQQCTQSSGGYSLNPPTTVSTVGCYTSGRCYVVTNPVPPQSCVYDVIYILLDGTQGPQQMVATGMSAKATGRPVRVDYNQPEGSGTACTATFIAVE